MASLKRTSNHGGISKVIAHNDGESEIELICSEWTSYVNFCKWAQNLIDWQIPLLLSTHYAFIGGSSF